MLQHAFDLKLALASGIGLLAAVTDAAVDPHGWEDLSLKVILMGAVIYIGRLYLAQQAEMREARADHKAELKETWAAHNAEIKIREELLHAALTKNTDKLTEVAALTKEQTDWLRMFSRRVTEERISKPTLP